MPRANVGAFQDKRNRDCGRRSVDEPDRELFEPSPDDRERAPEGKRRDDGAEDWDEESGGGRPENVPHERRCGNPHHEEFERRPTEELEHVQRRRDVRPPPTEDRTEAHHRRDARPTPVVGRRGKHDAPQHRADERHDRGLGERQAEPEAADADQERPRRKDEQPDAEARPQHEQVESPQDPQSRRHGFDTPFRRPAQTDHREAKASAYISGSRTGGDRLISWSSRTSCTNA